jgi:HEAT repeat protein
LTDRAEIEAALASSDPEERRLGAAQLAQANADVVAELLARALGDDDWRVRKEAAASAAAHSPSAQVLSTLVAALEPGENVGMRNAAVEALAGYGMPAIGALSIAVRGLDADGRKLAIEALGRSGRAQALIVLRELVNDPDANVRSAAVEAVAMIGNVCLDDATPILEDALASDDAYQRLAALEGLNRLGVTLDWEQIEPLLRDPVLERSALLAGGRGGHSEAAPMLAAALDAARGSAFVEVLAALVELSRAGFASLSIAQRALAGATEQVRSRILALASAANDALDQRRLGLRAVGLLASAEAASAAIEGLADDRVAAEAEAALAALGDTALPALIETAQHGHPELRAAVLDLLGRLPDTSIPPPAVHAVRGALDDAAPDVVRAALSTLALVGDQSALEPVAMRMSKESSPGVRQAAEAALSALARRHPEAARELARRAAPDGELAHAAAIVIAAIGSPVRASIELDVSFLSDSLSSDDSHVRRAAVEALAAIGSPLGVEAVAFALADDALEVQLAAVRALGRLRDEQGAAPGASHLLELLEASDDEQLVAAAIRALGEAGDARALGILRPLVRSDDAMRAVFAVEALARLDDPRRIDALIDALSHSDAEVVKAALRGLAAERDERVGAHLGACLDHEAWDVRRLAADLIGRSAQTNAIGLLRAKLSSEVEPLVREAIQRALVEVELGGGLRRTTPPPGTWRGR